MPSEKGAAPKDISSELAYNPYPIYFDYALREHPGPREGLSPPASFVCSDNLHAA
jgi:hypothetical protein